MIWLRRLGVAFIVIAGILIIAARVERRLRRPAAPPLPAALPATPPQPVGTPLPLVGEGVDEFGYPKQIVDAPKLRTLLAQKNFNDVTAHVEDLQTRFELDFKNEHLVADAISAFSVADPALPTLLDEWVAAFPGSFAPYAARGAYLADEAARRRGSKFMKDTPADALAAMAELHTRAEQDLIRALAQRGNVQAVWRQRIGIAMHHGAARGLIDAALATCPECFSVRSKYAAALTPRWGGTPQLQQAFIDESLKLVDKNPKLALLRGYPAWERCFALWRVDSLTAVPPDCDAAVAVGPSPFFLEERGLARNKVKDHEGALADFDAALKLTPGSAELHARRGRALRALKRMEQAVAAFEESLRLDPFEPATKADLIHALMSAAADAYNARRIPDAMTLYDRVLALDPTNAEAKTWKQNAAQRGQLGSAVDVARAAYEKNPDDFELVRALDYALLPERRLEEILPLWDKYIQAHPEDARAWFERSGTNHHLKRPADAKRDVVKACELGHAEACAVKARIP